MTMLNVSQYTWDQRLKLSEIRNHFGWSHLEDNLYFDRWLMNFLDNKGGNVKETIAKFERRLIYEEKELWCHEILQGMRENLYAGSLREIGEDLEGNMLYYVVTRRDVPTAANRPVRLFNFDVLFAYACRLRPNSKGSGGITFFVNYQDAGVWANTDISYLTSVGLRISKYWPGAIKRVVLVKMSNVLAAVLRPMIRALPKQIKESISVLSDQEIADGKLLEWFSPQVIPSEFGGLNDSDYPAQIERFADDVFRFYEENVKIFQNHQQSELSKQYKFCMLRYEVEEWLAEKANNSSPSVLRSPSFLPDAAPQTPRSPRSRSPSRDSIFHECEEYPSLQERHISFHPSIGGEDGTEQLEEWVQRRTLEEEEYCRGILLESEWDRRGDLVELCRATMELCAVQNNTVPAPERMAATCPDATRVIGRVIAWLCCTLMALFFTAATLFLLLLVLSLMQVTFLGMFHSTSQTIPCLLAFAVFGHQAALVTTRGYDCIRSAFHGESVLTFRMCGTARHGQEYSCYIQTGIWVLLLIICAFIFFLTIPDWDLGGEVLDSGIKIAFAWGWVGCAVVLMAFHSLFPTPLVEERQEHTSSEHGIELLSIYLLFNMTEDVEDYTDDETFKKEDFYRMIVASLFILCSVALGIAHMLVGGSKVLLIFASVMTILTALYSSYVIVSHRSMQSDLSRHLVLTLSWLFAIAWIYITPRVGALSIEIGGLDGTVLTIFLVVLFYFLLVVVAQSTKRNRKWRPWLLRAGYGYLSCMVAVTIVYAFALQWRFGLLLFILFLHCALCYTLRDGTNHVGVGLMVLGYISLSLVIFLLGYTLQVKEHAAPLAAMEEVGTGLTPYPLCNKLHGGADMSITDFSLFCNLAHAQSGSRALTEDLRDWFPTFTMESEKNFSGQVALRVFTSASQNTTVVSIRGATDLSFALKSTSAWVEVIALYPFELILPLNWTTQLVYHTSFLGRLLHFPTVHESVVAEVRRIVHNNSTESKHHQRRGVFITGYGYGGWLAQIVGSRLGIPTFAFASPGVQYSLEKFDLSWYSVVRNVVNIVPVHNAMARTDMHGGAVQPIACASTASSSESCASLLELTCELLRSCGSAGNRSLAACRIGRK